MHRSSGGVLRAPGALRPTLIYVGEQLELEKQTLKRSLISS